MNPNQEQLFFKHLILASKGMKEKELAENNLKAQMQKVKSVALKKGKKSEIQRELKELEHSLKEVLEKENILIREQESESETTKALREKLAEMEVKMAGMTRYDSEVVEALKKEINELEDELHVSKQERNLRAGEEKKKVEKIYAGIAELKSKMQEFIDKKTAHDARVLELEEKIKQGVSDNYIELLHLEQHLEEMEKRYEQMAGEGKYEQTILDEFRQKIINLKNRIWQKKGEFTRKMKPNIPRLMPIPKFISPKKEVRHDFKFEPVEEIEFKPHEQLLLPPMPPKKSIFRKFFTKFPP